MTSRADETERVVKENGELLLGSPWGTYSKKIIDSSYRIKKPVFATYDELEDILTISFRMYEDFKKACCKAS